MFQYQQPVNNDADASFAASITRALPGDAELYSKIRFYTLGVMLILNLILAIILGNYSASHQHPIISHHNDTSFAASLIHSLPDDAEPFIP